MEAEYIAVCEVAKESVWLKKFYTDLEVVPDLDKPLAFYCNNSGVVTSSKELRSHKRGKHIKEEVSPHQRDRAQSRCQCSQDCFRRQFCGPVYQDTAGKGIQQTPIGNGT